MKRLISHGHAIRSMLASGAIGDLNVIVPNEGSSLPSRTAVTCGPFLLERRPVASKWPSCSHLLTTTWRGAPGLLTCFLRGDLASASPAKHDDARRDYPDHHADEDEDPDRTLVAKDRLLQYHVEARDPARDTDDETEPDEPGGERPRSEGRDGSSNQKRPDREHVQCVKRVGDRKHALRHRGVDRAREPERQSGTEREVLKD